MKRSFTAIAIALALVGCNMSMLDIERPLRSELQSASDDMPVGRVFVVLGEQLYVMNLARDGDQVRITNVRTLLREDSGGQADVATLMTDPERIFRLAPGGENLFVQLTISAGSEATYSGVFARRRCRGEICLVEIRDTIAWSAEAAAAQGYFAGYGGVACQLSGNAASGCTLNDPAAFARNAANLDQSVLLRTEPAAFLVPSARQPTAP
ncbi:MAG: hypothetical protein J0L81_12185 [Caulobacterales bacterium]|jgi:hypothetical protein|nr:hypothetical protein [Caulobacterales bacterium]